MIHELIHAALPLGGVQPTGDARLPKDSRKKVQALRQDQADALAMVHAATDALVDARNDLARSENRLGQFKQNAIVQQYRPGEGEPAEHPTLVHEGRKRDEAAAEVARLNEVVAGRTARHQQIGGVVSATDRYLRQIGPGPVLSGKTSAPALRRGDDEYAAIEARRRRLRELEADAHQVRSAPIPSALAKKHAVAQIEQLVERGRPDVSELLASNRPIQWPTLPGGVIGVHGATEFSTGILPSSSDAIALLALVHKDALIAAVEREIDELADDRAALSDESRAKKLAQIEADRLETEREEEALIERAATRGLEVLRRPDADVRATLGIVGPAPASR